MKRALFVLAVAVATVTGALTMTTDASPFGVPASHVQAYADTLSDGAAGVLLGTLRANTPQSIAAPKEYCVPPNDYFMLEMGAVTDELEAKYQGTHYQGFDYRIDGYNLTFADGVDPAPFADKAVVKVTGTFHKGLMKHLKKLGTCNPFTFEPPMQIRSDWGNPECGGRVGITSAAKLDALYSFHVTAIEAVDLVTATFDGSVVEAKVTNVLPVELPVTTADFVFQGGAGKPGEKHDSHTVGPLAPGKTSSFQTIDLMVSKEPIKWSWMLTSITLTEAVDSPEGRTLILVDAPFHKLGLDPLVITPKMPSQQQQQTMP